MSDELADGLAMERIEQWQRGFEERAAQARALSERTAGLSATARGGGGAVEVTGGPGVQITDLRLGEQVRRQAPDVTARQILAAIAAAKTSLARDFTQVAAETVGLGSPTGDALVKSMNARLGVEPE